MKTKTLFIGIFCFACSLYGESVGIIGGGGSGLTTAWLLENDYDVTLFEAQDRLGGHANTIDVEINGKTVPIEGGFEFISRLQFPNFLKLLTVLNVPLNAFPLITTFYTVDGSDVIILPPYHNGKIEWESISPSDIFDLLQYNTVIEYGERLLEIQDVAITLEDFVENIPLTRDFKKNFFYPFLSAGWGVAVDRIKGYSAYNVLKYAVMGKQEENYEWYEVAGGTRVYVEALAGQLNNAKVKLSSRIDKILYNGRGYEVFEEDGSITEFDHLVITTNAMDAEKLLKDIPETLDIRSILGNIRYIQTTIAIHSDPRFMPPDTDDWRVVNIRFDGINSAITVHKKWLSDAPVFKSWITLDVRGGNGSPVPDNLHALAYYDHAVVDPVYFQVQKAIGMVQGNRNLWFAGNWTHDNDSHESAVTSAMKIAEKLAPHAPRLHLLVSEG